MAGGCSISEDRKIDLVMTCRLGKHPLKNPKLLPCQHSFCEECLKAKVGKDNKMTCPQCQLSIPLTETGINQLPEDVLFHIKQESKDSHRCVICNFDEKNIPGTFQCLDCGDVLCDECKIGHRKTTLTRSHRIIPMKDIHGGKYKMELKDTTQLVCSSHSKEHAPMLLQYYCEDCKILACQLCAIKDHQPKGHICKTTSEVYDAKIHVITKEITKLLGVKQFDAGFADFLEQSLEQNKELQDKLENEVHERAALFIDIIEKVKTHVLSEIKDHFKNESDSLSMKLSKAKNRIICKESIASFTQEFLEHSSKAEFIQNEGQISESLRYREKGNIDKTFKTIRFDPNETDIEGIEEWLTKAFGKINIETKIYGSHDWMKKPKILFLQEMGDSLESAYGLTVTENGDIVTVRGSTIQLFDQDGNLKESINTEYFQDAWNIVAKGDTLYISSHGHENVFLTDFKGNVKKSISLPQASQGHGEKGLAVGDDGIVYISSRNTSTIYRCGPQETHANEFISRDIHPDFNQPIYLCLTPTSDIIVSNYGSSTVQAFSHKGEYLWQYKGQGEMTLNLPYGICCDEEGHIYISNSKQHRIQVIKNNQLETCFEIKTLKNPYGIDLDKQGNIVCVFNSGNVIAKVKLWE